MKSLFDSVSIQSSKLTTKAYSTSFSAGIYFLNARLRNPIYAIYGFVRFADEIVDSFEGYDKEGLLNKYRNETFDAIKEGISLNPILNAFQHTVNEYQIDHTLIDTFLKSMEMDLERKNHSRDTFEAYILGSAEVVGLMCLHVFTEGDREMFEQLKPCAMKLGSAFQKVNFLRDLNADYKGLGRSYFPGIEMTEFSNRSKREIEEEIEKDFKASLSGIKKLPSSSRGGVYLAYVYYKSLFNKIRNIPAERVMTERVRINNFEKLVLMFNSMLHYKMKLL